MEELICFYMYNVLSLCVVSLKSIHAVTPDLEEIELTNPNLFINCLLQIVFW